MMHAEQPFESADIFTYLYRRRKFLFVVAGVAALTAIIVTSFIPKKYESSGIVFPPGTYSDNSMENPQFGYQVQADRLVQIGQSAVLKDSLIKRFDLYTFYKIDSTGKDARFRIHKVLDNSLDFEKTKYLSVVVSAKTRDPVLSANLVNAAIDLVGFYHEDMLKTNVFKALSYSENQYRSKNDEVIALVEKMNSIRSENANQTMALVRQQLTERQQNVSALMDRMAALRESGKFYDFGQQMDLLTEQLLEGRKLMALEKGKMSVMEESSISGDTTFILSKGRYQGVAANEEELEKQIAGLQAVEKEYSRLSSQIEREWDRINELKRNYDQLAHTYQPYIESVDLTHLEKRYQSELEILDLLKERYESAFRFYHQPMPGIFIMDRAEPVFKETSPSYKLNVLISVIVSLVLAIIGDLFYARMKAIKSRES